MSFGERVVGAALEALGLPFRAVARVAALVLVGMFLLFPGTAGKGLLAWSESQARIWTRAVMDHLPAAANSSSVVGDPSGRA